MNKQNNDKTTYGIIITVLLIAIVFTIVIKAKENNTQEEFIGNLNWSYFNSSFIESNITLTTYTIDCSYPNSNYTIRIINESIDGEIVEWREFCERLGVVTKVETNEITWKCSLNWTCEDGYNWIDSNYSSTITNWDADYAPQETNLATWAWAQPTWFEIEPDTNQYRTCTAEVINCFKVKQRIKGGTQDD